MKYWLWERDVSTLYGKLLKVCWLKNCIVPWNEYPAIAQCVIKGNGYEGMVKFSRKNRWTWWWWHRMTLAAGMVDALGERA